MIVKPRFFNCRCGKLHVEPIMNHITRCKCGALLWEQSPNYTRRKAMPST